MRFGKELLYLSPILVYAGMSLLDEEGLSVVWLLVALGIAALAALAVDGARAGGKAAWRRSLRLPAGADPIAWIGIVAACLPIAFFVAGAVGLPLSVPGFRWAFVVTAGVANVIWGIESVVRFGRIETCGFFSGACTLHDVRWMAIGLWVAFSAIAVALWHRGRHAAAARSAADAPSGRPMS